MCFLRKRIRYRCARLPRYSFKITEGTSFVIVKVQFVVTSDHIIASHHFLCLAWHSCIPRLALINFRCMISMLMTLSISPGHLTVLPCLDCWLCFELELSGALVKMACLSHFRKPFCNKREARETDGNCCKSVPGIPSMGSSAKAQRTALITKLQKVCDLPGTFPGIV